MSSSRVRIDTDGAPTAIGPYSQGIVSNGLLFCSGQIPVDPQTGELVGGGTGDQLRRCLDNLSAVCAEAGAELADAVRITVYLTDMGAFAEVNEAYATYFGDPPPARVAIGVAALPKGAQVEVDAVVACVT
ncbi:MAG TPA: RidA family protein [Solirubrobacteraceae bacterium]